MSYLRRSGTDPRRPRHAYTYKGEITLINAVTADFCPGCDESITDMAETERVMSEMQTFNKQVNADIQQAGECRHC